MTELAATKVRAAARAGVARLPAAAILLVSGLGWAAAVHAADPSPAASPALRHETNVVVWFDEPLPPDIPVGNHVPIGFTLWDRAQAALSEQNEVEVRVHPAAGKAAPTQAHALSDWPGHLTATITIPKGGLGVIDVGSLDQVCRDNGSCVSDFLALTVGGIGPPPDAKLSTLIDATIQVPPGRFASGEPISLAAMARPRVAWDSATVPLPDHLIVNAMTLRGEDLATAELVATPTQPGRFQGSVTIQEPGDVVLVLAIPAERGPDETLEASRVQLKVVDGGSGPAAAAVPIPGTGETLPILQIVAAAAIVILASLVVRRAFADL